MSYDLTLHFLFRKFALSFPPIRRKTNSVLANVPLNVIPIMLKSFFMGVFFLTEFKFFSLWKLLKQMLVNLKI